MSRRIFICGPSGTGKTTLAKILSEYYEMGKFISGSSKALWDKYGIKNHINVIENTVMDPIWGYNFQMELLDLRIKLFEVSDNINIVSDRSPLDNVIYFTLQNAPFEGTLNTERYLYKAFKSFKKGDWLVVRYYPPQLMGQYGLIENDSMRITNVYYHLAYQTLLDRELVTMQEQGVNVIKFPYTGGEINEGAIEKLVQMIKENG